MNKLEYIIDHALSKLLSEAPAKETNNAPAQAADSPFTPAEEKFLGKFDAYGTRHIGIMYSPSDIGISEFINRSGVDLNLTPEILLNLIRNEIIKIVPYTGFGRNDNYTLELQLSLDDVAGLGAEDKKNIEAGTAGGGTAGAPPAGELPMPGPEVSWYRPAGQIINESGLSLHNYSMIVEQRTETQINTYMEDNKFKPYIIRAYTFWDQMQAANLDGFNLGETEFFAAFNQLLSVGNVRTNCIFADAIAKIMIFAQTKRGASAEARLLTQFRPANANLWSSIDIIYSTINDILNSPPIKTWILSDEKTKALKLLNRLDAGGAGSFSQIAISQEQSRLYTPNYIDSDVRSIIQKLLQPWSESTKKQTYGDTLSSAERVKRGKWALKKISMRDTSIDKLNYLKFYDTVLAISKDQPDYVKFWADKNGVGYVWFGVEAKLRLYADGTCIYNNVKTTYSRIYSKVSNPDAFSQYIEWMIDTPKGKEITLAGGYV
jgi:hypothetical protein